MEKQQTTDTSVTLNSTSGGSDNKPSSSARMSRQTTFELPPEDNNEIVAESGLCPLLGGVSSKVRQMSMRRTTDSQNYFSQSSQHAVATASSYNLLAGVNLNNINTDNKDGDDNNFGSGMNSANSTSNFYGTATASSGNILNSRSGTFVDGQFQRPGTQQLKIPLLQIIGEALRVDEFGESQNVNGPQNQTVDYSEVKSRYLEGVSPEQHFEKATMRRRQSNAMRKRSGGKVYNNQEEEEEELEGEDHDDGIMGGEFNIITATNETGGVRFSQKDQNIQNKNKNRSGSGSPTQVTNLDSLAALTSSGPKERGGRRKGSTSPPKDQQRTRKESPSRRRSSSTGSSSNKKLRTPSPLSPHGQPTRDESGGMMTMFSASASSDYSMLQQQQQQQQPFHIPHLPTTKPKFENEEERIKWEEEQRIKFGERKLFDFEERLSRQENDDRVRNFLEHYDIKARLAVEEQKEIEVQKHRTTEEIRHRAWTYYKMREEEMLEMADENKRKNAFAERWRSFAEKKKHNQQTMLWSTLLLSVILMRRWDRERRVRVASALMAQSVVPLLRWRHKRNTARRAKEALLDAFSQEDKPPLTVDTLRTDRLLSLFSRDHLAGVIDNGTIKLEAFLRGYNLCYYREPGRDCFVLVYGEVDVLVPATGSERNQQLLSYTTYEENEKKQANAAAANATSSSTFEGNRIHQEGHLRKQQQQQHNATSPQKKHHPSQHQHHTSGTSSTDNENKITTENAEPGSPTNEGDLEASASKTGHVAWKYQRKVTLRAPFVIGSIGMITKERRNARLQCRTDCLCYVINHDEFMRERPSASVMQEATEEARKYHLKNMTELYGAFISPESLARYYTLEPMVKHDIEVYKKWVEAEDKKKFEAEMRRKAATLKVENEWKEKQRKKTRQQQLAASVGPVPAFLSAMMNNNQQQPSPSSNSNSPVTTPLPTPTTTITTPQLQSQDTNDGVTETIDSNNILPPSAFSDINNKEKEKQEKEAAFTAAIAQSEKELEAEYNKAHSNPLFEEKFSQVLAEICRTKIILNEQHTEERVPVYLKPVIKKPGEYIIRCGQRSSSMFFLMDGKVDLCPDNEDFDTPHAVNQAKALAMIDVIGPTQREKKKAGDNVITRKKRLQQMKVFRGDDYMPIEDTADDDDEFHAPSNPQLHMVEEKTRVHSHRVVVSVKAKTLKKYIIGGPRFFLLDEYDMHVVVRNSVDLFELSREDFLKIMMPSPTLLYTMRELSLKYMSEYLEPPRDAELALACFRELPQVRFSKSRTTKTSEFGRTLQRNSCIVPAGTLLQFNSQKKQHQYVYFILRGELSRVGAAGGGGNTSVVSSSATMSANYSHSTTSRRIHSSGKHSGGASGSDSHSDAEGGGHSRNTSARRGLHHSSAHPSFASGSHSQSHSVSPERNNPSSSTHHSTGGATSEHQHHSTATTTTTGSRTRRRLGAKTGRDPKAIFKTFAMSVGSFASHHKESGGPGGGGGGGVDNSNYAEILMWPSLTQVFYAQSSYAQTVTKRVEGFRVSRNDLLKWMINIIAPPMQSTSEYEERQRLFTAAITKPYNDRLPPFLIFGLDEHVRTVFTKWECVRSVDKGDSSSNQQKQQQGGGGTLNESSSSYSSQQMGLGGGKSSAPSSPENEFASLGGSPGRQHREPQLQQGSNQSPIGMLVGGSLPSMVSNITTSTTTSQLNPFQQQQQQGGVTSGRSSRTSGAGAVQSFTSTSSRSGSRQQHATMIGVPPITGLGSLDNTANSTTLLADSTTEGRTLKESGRKISLVLQSGEVVAPGVSHHHPPTTNLQPSTSTNLQRKNSIVQIASISDEEEEDVTHSPSTTAQQQQQGGTVSGMMQQHIIGSAGGTQQQQRIHSPTASASLSTGYGSSQSLPPILTNIQQSNSNATAVPHYLQAKGTRNSNQRYNDDFSYESFLAEYGLEDKHKKKPKKKQMVSSIPEHLRSSNLQKMNMNNVIADKLKKSHNNTALGRSRRKSSSDTAEHHHQSKSDYYDEDANYVAELEKRKLAKGGVTTVPISTIFGNTSNRHTTPSSHHTNAAAAATSSANANYYSTTGITTTTTASASGTPIQKHSNTNDGNVVTKSGTVVNVNSLPSRLNGGGGGITSSPDDLRLFSSSSSSSASAGVATVQPGSSGGVMSTLQQQQQHPSSARNFSGTVTTPPLASLWNASVDSQQPHSSSARPDTSSGGAGGGRNVEVARRVALSQSLKSYQKQTAKNSQKNFSFEDAKKTSIEKHAPKNREDRP